MPLKLGMFTCGCYYWDGGSRYSTESNWRGSLLSGYAKYFDEIRVFARVSRRNFDNIPASEIFQIPNVKFVHLPVYSRFVGFHKHRRKIHKLIHENIVGLNACFFRVPCQISDEGITIANSMKIPTICQLVGDSHHVMRYDTTIYPNKFVRFIASRYTYYKQRKVANSCDVQASISKIMAVKYYKHPDKATILPNTLITSDSFIPFRSRNNGEVFNALYVGRVEHHKNPQLFLYAVAKLKKSNRNIKTTIVGDGRYLPTLKSLAEKLGISDSVDFVGRVKSREKLLEYYRQAHMLYLLSFSEGLGLVLMEAGAASLPIIGSRVGGIPELARENENAFLVDPNDIKGCVSATERLMDDESLRDKMGKKSQAIMKDYTIEAVALKASNLIRSSVQK
ncbi:MAG: glycosyltransferase family 4 protein [Nitrospinales bacterium]